MKRLITTVVLAGAGATAMAQASPAPLGSPLGNPIGGAAAAAPGGGAPAVGSGPGFHSPQSPIPPLQERDGVVSWKLLSSVTTKVERNRMRPQFPDGVKALDKRTVKIQGFMMPLEPGDRQRHFLLSSVPTTCSFCIPAGPEGLVEVRTREPVRYGIEPVVVEGRLAVLDNDPYGLYYRIVDGMPAR